MSLEHPSHNIFNFKSMRRWMSLQPSSDKILVLIQKDVNASASRCPLIGLGDFSTRRLAPGGLPRAGSAQPVGILFLHLRHVSGERQEPGPAGGCPHSVPKQGERENKSRRSP